MSDRIELAKTKKKNTGVMRWLNPDWSIVRWVKNFINDEENPSKEAVS